MVECGGLENRCRFAPTQGSNPCLSAIILNLLDYYQYLASISKFTIPRNIPHQRFVPLLVHPIIWKIAKASCT